MYALNVSSKPLSPPPHLLVHPTVHIIGSGTFAINAALGGVGTIVRGTTRAHNRALRAGTTHAGKWKDVCGTRVLVAVVAALRALLRVKGNPRGWCSHAQQQPQDASPEILNFELNYTPKKKYSFLCVCSQLRRYIFDFVDGRRFTPQLARQGWPTTPSWARALRHSRCLRP